jgi:hypothetical protein
MAHGGNCTQAEMQKLCSILEHPTDTFGPSRAPVDTAQSPTHDPPDAASARLTTGALR